MLIFPDVAFQTADKDGPWKVVLHGWRYEGSRGKDWLGFSATRWVERIAQHPTLSKMIDTERLIAALDAFPDQTSTDPQVWLQVELGVPRALLTARFIDFVERSNRI